LSRITLLKRFSLETISAKAAFEIKGGRGLYRRYLWYVLVFNLLLLLLMMMMLLL